MVPGIALPSSKVNALGLAVRNWRTLPNLFSGGRLRPLLDPRRTLALAALLLAAAVPADAQYFGRNKVRWDSREVRVLATQHFDIHHDPSSEEAARIAARLAERWYARLSALLQHELKGRQAILLYAGHPHFEQTNAVSGPLHESTGGVTEALKRRIVLPFAGPLAETDHVIGHELVHAFQFDIMGGRNRAALRLPLWFVEGMAEYLTLGPLDPHTGMWMRDAARAGRLPRVRDLGHPRYFPYRFGHAFWAYVGGRWGDEAVARALKAAARSRRSPIRAIERVLGVREEALSREWQDAVREAYGEDGTLLAGPESFGRRLIAGTKKGLLNVAPALSPDGRRLAFLSERDGGSLELFLADAETGRRQRRLLRRRLDPHYDALQFVGSAGAWDTAGRRFAFAAVRRGRPVLSILDVDRGAVAREIALPSLDEALNPTFSPDGTRVAFSAIRGGITDLYVYDLATDRLEALTSDVYADLQPTWSPDGKTLAFVTDRFDTRLDELRWGRYRLARLTLATAGIEPLPCFPDARNVNPQWGAGGRWLYFLSDQNGISNVYRLEIATGAVRQITDVGVGISGLTPLSPALGSAAAADRLVVTAYARGRYHIHSIEERGVLEGREPDPAEDDAFHLPPRERGPSVVQDWLEDPARGLVGDDAVSSATYVPRLTSDGLADPFFSVGGDRYGLSVLGGASAFWSDLLGNHNVAASARMIGGIRDLSGVAAYTNRTRRWTWGVAAQQRTFRTGSLSSGVAVLDGRNVAVEQLVRFREIDRGWSARVTYPFDRGHRLELMGGLRHVAFSSEAVTRLSAFETGQRLRESRDALPAPPSLRLGEVGAAFVHDTTRFGPTGPIRGQRYRLEVTPTFGDKVFAGVRVDYRRYLMPVRPFTIAARAVHVGRYGPDADDPRVAPLYAGYPHLVRGYEGLGSSRCRPGGCPRLAGLIGSKLLVANAELRFPALAWLSRDRPYGPVPAELALFFDSGVAWSGDRPRGLGGSRDWIRSWGAAVRVNLLGLAAGEMAYVRPLDLEGKDAVWRLRLGLGF